MVTKNKREKFFKKLKKHKKQKGSKNKDEKSKPKFVKVDAPTLEENIDSLNVAAVKDTRVTDLVVAELMQRKVIAVNFKFNNYQLSSYDEGLIKHNIDSITPQKIRNVYITGFTYSDHNIFYNQKLSIKRVQQVRDYLLQCGVNESAITVKKLSKHLLINSADTEDVKGQNRRVEISIGLN